MYKKLSTQYIQRSICTPAAETVGGKVAASEIVTMAIPILIVIAIVEAHSNRTAWNEKVYKLSSQRLKFGGIWFIRRTALNLLP